MNLQILSLQTLMKSGQPFDKSDPVMNNIMFDVKLLLNDTILKIRRLQKQLEDAQKNLGRLSEFKTIKLPDMRTYDRVVDQISELLFDDMDFERINTQLQIEWKEYFHGLYDLVIFPYQRDHTHYIQMVNELYKYFDVLRPPSTQLEPQDPLYVDTKTCIDLFRKLKIEHKKILVPKLFKKMKQNVDNQVKSRLHYIRLKKELLKLYKIQEDCVNLKKWHSSS